MTAATTTRERPILFSGPMVRAIMAGRKAQTRRIINPQFEKLWGHGVRLDDDAYSVHVDIPELGGTWKWLRCPFGKVGDVLWVRETFANGIGGPMYRADCGAQVADCTWRHVDDFNRFIDVHRGGWKPSIHMPRDLARLFLRVTDVRVERLNAISEADAEAEGPPAFGIDCQPGHYWRVMFKELWESIHGPHSWSVNPWVWVVEFEKVRSP